MLRFNIKVWLDDEEMPVYVSLYFAEEPSPDDVRRLVRACVVGGHVTSFFVDEINASKSDAQAWRESWV